MTEFDLPGALRRVRRRGDLSQRELADLVGVSKSLIGAVESGKRQLDLGILSLAAGLVGLRLALVDSEGREAAGMAADAVRDMSGRRFPAHLDTRHSDEGWWHDAHRYSRPRPWYTFDRNRRWRDIYRARDGVPDDHQLPLAGDSPQERAAARRREAARERAAERERRFLAGEFAHVGGGFTCTCPPACDELDDWSGRPVHCEECTCHCDVG